MIAFSKSPEQNEGHEWAIWNFEGLQVFNMDVPKGGMFSMNGSHDALSAVQRIGLLLFLAVALAACSNPQGDESSTPGARQGGATVGPTPPTTPPTTPPPAPALHTYLVTWDPVVDPLVTGYKLYYSLTPFSSGPAVGAIAVTGTSYVFDPTAVGISAGRTVYMGIAAVGNGLESPLSDPASVVIQ